MLDKKYNHLEVEKNKYEEWKSHNYFKCDDKKDKTPYCIVIPPPNVTGKLHLGHAYDTTIQDIIIRYKRMQGFDTLWLPGMDHAAQTALSNEKVIYKDVEGAFYHLKYVIDGTDKFLDVATTRPETLFGDTAVAVNPEDERYKEFIGKNVILPVVGKKIPIIADIHADPEFGTGCVKSTPNSTNTFKTLKIKGSLGYAFC